MATHSSILAWRIPWRGAWWATVPGAAKELDTSEQKQTHTGLSQALVAAAAAAKSLQSCLTLCDPIDGSPPGSAVPGFSRQEHWSGLPFPL